MNTTPLPKLAFVYSSLNAEEPPLLLAEAADGVASLLWVLRDSSDMPRAVRRVLQGIGEIVDVSGLSATEAAPIVRTHGAEGIVCFNDDNLVWTAELAQAISLTFFSPDVAARLTDKLLQRTALRDHDLVTPPFWNADDLSTPSKIDEVARTAGYPVVLKPRRGRASQDVEAIGSSADLAAAMVSAAGGRMLVEGFIPDPTGDLASASTAPYVSVELVASKDEFTVLGVTGRPPLAPPFRETGVIFPADIPPELRRSVVDEAVAGCRALGAHTGPLHVEVKLTDDGPVVIEVNGVMGGGAIRELMQSTLGVDVIELTMRVALGEAVAFGELDPPTEVGFLFEIQPDMDAHRVVSVEGLDSVSNISGVERVIPGLRAGDECTWRTGTTAFVAGIFGTAPDHPSAYRIRDEFVERVVVTTA